MHCSQTRDGPTYANATQAAAPLVVVSCFQVSRGGGSLSYDTALCGYETVVEAYGRVQRLQMLGAALCQFQVCAMAL